MYVREGFIKKNYLWNFPFSGLYPPTLNGETSGVEESVIEKRFIVVDLVIVASLSSLARLQWITCRTDILN